MRKKTYVLNRFSNRHTVAVGKFDHNVDHLDSSQQINRPLLARKISLHGNVSIERLQKAQSHTHTNRANWEESVVWKKGQRIRFFSAFILLCIGLFFQYNGHFSHTIVSSLYLLAIAVGGYRLFLVSVSNLLAWHIDMRTLMFIPLVGVILLGRWLEGAIFVLLLMINVAIETYSINIAKRSMQGVFSLASNKAVLQIDGKFVTKDVTEVDVNEVIVVAVGEQIPLDGVIVNGETYVNEKIITGYSSSSLRREGDEVFAGCLNEKDTIFIKVQKRAHETKIAQIIAFVEEAQKKPAPAQHFIENFMTYYTPLIMLLAVFIAALPPLVAGANWDKWVYLAFAILVVACPCALIISTPIAFITGLSNAAKSGILLKNASAIEELSRIRGIVFNQFGTLTVGNPRITNVVSLVADEAALIRIGASISSSCDHPFGRAVVSLAKERNISVKKVLQFRTIEGKGAFGLIDGKMYTIGSSQLLTEDHAVAAHIWDEIEQLQLAGKSVVTVSTTNELLGYFTMQDEVRPEAKAMIEGLKKERIKRLFLMTEDSEDAANQLAEKLGIQHVYSNLQADRKVTKINKLRYLYSHIAFVSPNSKEHDESLLSHASVTITNGAEINERVLENSEVVFLDENLTKLPALIHFSKKTIRIVKYNILIVFLLKIAALLLVIPGILTLWMAIVVDIIASLIILFNTLRLTK